MNNFASKFKKSKKPKIERVEKYKKPKIKNVATPQKIDEISLGEKLVTMSVTDYTDLPVGSIACVRSQGLQEQKTTFNQFVSMTTFKDPERFDKDGNLNLYFVLGNDVESFISEADLKKKFGAWAVNFKAYCACLFNGEIIPVRKSSLVVKKRI